MKFPPGLYYDKEFVTADEHKKVLEWLKTLYPIWENRYAKNHPPPKGKDQRQLLRPVYWLGNWQFACLNYYRPPKNVRNCCVKAEPYPAVLQHWVERIEKSARKIFSPKDIPVGWKLNTCLLNFYGNRVKDGKTLDCARVGEHKDFEPGPVASVSLGERAFFQFVASRGYSVPSHSVLQQWLEDGSLQLFGGPRWKQHLFHRVQRVEDKGLFRFHLNVENFETRRLNFTFRFVPEYHVVPFAELDAPSAEDVRPYVEQLAVHSKFFEHELKLRPQ